MFKLHDELFVFTMKWWILIIVLSWIMFYWSKWSPRIGKTCLVFGPSIHCAAPALPTDSYLWKTITCQTNLLQLKYLKSQVLLKKKANYVMEWSSQMLVREAIKPKTNLCVVLTGKTSVADLGQWNLDPVKVSFNGCTSSLHWKIGPFCSHGFHKMTWPWDNVKPRVYLALMSLCIYFFYFYHSQS